MRVEIVIFSTHSHPNRSINDWQENHHTVDGMALHVIICPITISYILKLICQHYYLLIGLGQCINLFGILCLACGQTPKDTAYQNAHDHNYKYVHYQQTTSPDI